MKKLKKGYHYTSKKNWEQIQKSGGMKPYFNTTDRPGWDAAKKLFPNGIMGTWIWKDEPTGLSHAGNILYQVGRRGDAEIVKLEIQYDPQKRIKHGRQDIEFNHAGSVENFHYHYADPGIIVQGEIPVQHIRVIGSYNTVQRLQ